MLFVNSSTRVYVKAEDRAGGSGGISRRGAKARQTTKTKGFVFWNFEKERKKDKATTESLILAQDER